MSGLVGATQRDLTLRVLPMTGELRFEAELADRLGPSTLPSDRLGSQSPRKSPQASFCRR